MSRRGWRKRLKKWRKGLFDTLLVGGCIQLLTLPLTVYFYYEFPVYSVLINGLLLPFMGFLLLSGIIGGLVGAGAVLIGTCGSPAVLCGGLAGMCSTGLNELAWLLLQPAGLLLRWNEWVCNLFQKLPKAVWITGQPPMWMMIGYYVILAATPLMISDKTVLLKKSAVLSLTVASLLILLLVRPKQENQVCFLDVGQGDGIYIATEEGMSFFVDGGSNNVKKVGEYRILSFLKYRGVSGIDGWFVSHADLDHISGLLELWESGYTIKRLFLSQWIVRDEAWQELTETAAKYGTEIIYLKPGDTAGTESVRLTCLFPWEEGTDRNENSLVLKLESPGMIGFFGGDISGKQEKIIAERYPGLTVNLYKASHHGSKNSNGDEILKCLSPAASVISCGEKNSYGHPGAEAVERMRENGSEIFYTMKGGQITVGADEMGMWVKGFKE